MITGHFTFDLKYCIIIRSKFSSITKVEYGLTGKARHKKEADKLAPERAEQRTFVNAKGRFGCWLTNQNLSPQRKFLK